MRRRIALLMQRRRPLTWAENKPVSEETRTVTVNAHGAMVLLGLKVLIGQLLTLRNSRTGEEVACRVVYVSPHESEKRQVGVDFMEPCPRFWRISFPPANWTTRSPEAKGNPSHSATHGQIQDKRNEIRFSISSCSSGPRPP